MISATTIAPDVCVTGASELAIIEIRSLIPFSARIPPSQRQHPRLPEIYEMIRSGGRGCALLPGARMRDGDFLHEDDGTVRYRASSA